MGKKVILLFFWLLGLQCTAQQGWESKLLGGYLISHHPEMQNMEAHVGGVELNRYWTLKSSQKPFNGMKVGISAMYMYLGKPNINGSAIALQPNIVANLTPNAKNPFTMRWAVGLGYITKPFSYPDNIKNKAVGTHFNGCMQMQFNKYWVINKNYKAILGGGLTHFSNGNFKKPNLGINMPHLIFGVNYIPSSSIPIFKQMDTSYTTSKNSITISMAYAKREVSIGDPKKIHIGILGFDYRIYRKLGHYFRVGTDFFFDPSYPYMDFEDSTTYTLANSMEHGIRLGYEWQVNRVSLTADVGVYTYRPQKLKRMHYITVGMDYDITKNLSAFVKLKTHLSVADYFQWGLTYRIYEH